MRTSRTSTTRANRVPSTVGRIAIMLIFATVIGGISMTPALAEEHDKRQGEQGRRGHEPERHDERDQRGERDRRGERDYGYYSPPPVFYAPPPPSPGISFFFRL